MKKIKLPNTFVLIFSLLVLIAGLTWFVPGGEYTTAVSNGRTVIVPGSFHYIKSNPQGFGALVTAPIKGFVEAALIIGFVLIVGGSFSVLQKTEAIDALIKSIAKAHARSSFVRVMLIPLFMLLFSTCRRGDTVYWGANRLCRRVSESVQCCHCARNSGLAAVLWIRISLDCLGNRQHSRDCVCDVVCKAHQSSSRT